MPRRLRSDGGFTLNDLQIKGEELEVEWTEGTISEARVSNKRGARLRVWMWLTLLVAPLSLLTFYVMARSLPKEPFVWGASALCWIVAGYVLSRWIQTRIQEDFDKRIRAQLNQNAEGRAYHPARMVIEALMVFQAVRDTRPRFATKKKVFGSNTFPNNIETCMLPPLIDAINLCLARFKELSEPHEVKARAIREEYDQRLATAAKHLDDFWSMWQRVTEPVDYFWRCVGPMSCCTLAVSAFGVVVLLFGGGAR